MSTEITHPIVTFKPKVAVKEKLMYNLVGVLPERSKPNEVVIISANYYHIGVSSPRGDRTNERTILFIAFG